MFKKLRCNSLSKTFKRKGLFRKTRQADHEDDGKEFLLLRRVFRTRRFQFETPKTKG